MDAELIKKIDDEIDKARDAVAKDTIALVRINSEQGEPAPNAPYGLGPKKVLDTVLEMGKDDGFYCTDYGVGVISLGLKEGHPDLGIWLHGDVVPAGEGWILQAFRAFGGSRISIGSDAHHTYHVGAGVRETCAILRENGFDSVTIYRQRKPVQRSI